MNIKERRNQWAQEDWRRDIACYTDCANKLREYTAPHFQKLREHWKKACNEIADRYPNAKLQHFE